MYVIVQERPDYALKIGDVTTRIGLDGSWVAANHGPSYAVFAISPGDIASVWTGNRAWKRGRN